MACTACSPLVAGSRDSYSTSGSTTCAAKVALLASPKSVSSSLPVLLLRLQADSAAAPAASNRMVLERIAGLLGCRLRVRPVRRWGGGRDDWAFLVILAEQQRPGRVGVLDPIGRQHDLAGAD